VTALFVRTKRHPGSKNNNVLICHSIREGKQVYQKVICRIGKGSTKEELITLGYRLFSGNTAEVTTLIECVNYWKETLSIGKVVVVGDRAMMSEGNIEKLEQAGLQYILAYPMKKCSKVVKEQILSNGNYEPEVIQNEFCWKKEIKLTKSQRLIATYNQKRHARDEKQRGRLIEKIRKKLGKTKRTKRLVSNQGYLNYYKLGDKYV
jgi:transposase